MFPSHDQTNFVINGLSAVQVRPHPTSAWDATPQAFAKARALAAKGQVYDVDGASTLGKISAFNIQVDLAPDPQKLADGEYGYGLVLPGQIAISGTVTALFTDSTMMDFAEAHTSKKMVIETSSKSGDETLVITLPANEYGEPGLTVNTKQGQVNQINWTAHAESNDDPITFELTNSIASLASA
jgi:hypothetical protein